jgi:hypothetical protein
MSVVNVKDAGGSSIERLNNMLHSVPGGIWKAAHSALKRAGDTAKTRAGQFAAGEYAVTKAAFMKNVRVKSNITGGSGGVVSMNIGYAGNVLPLLEFNTKFSRGGYVTTQVKRNGGAAALQHAFAARVFGQTAVFERIGAPRSPVRQLYGPSTAHMMQNEAVTAKMDETVRETFEKRVEHEITRVLNGWGGKS